MTEYVFFYGHIENKPYACFSNFYPSIFVDSDGRQYNCSEQYFMKKKQEMFDSSNVNLANQIMNTADPRAIKKFGRQVKNYNESVWNINRYNIMVQALLLKFSQNQNLKQQLLATDNKILCECTNFDTIWANGLSMTNPERFDQTKWKGQNLLGKALMEVRNKLKN